MKSKHLLTYQFGLGLVLIILITLMFPQSRVLETINLKEGDVYIGEEIIAPFTFAINKSSREYQTDVEKARQSVSHVYARRSDITEDQISTLDSFIVNLFTLWTAPVASTQKLDSLKQFFKDRNIVLSDEDSNYFLNHRPVRISGSSSSQSPSMRNILSITPFSEIHSIASDLYAIGVLDREKDDLPGYVTKISVLSNGVETLESLDYYNGPNEVLTDALERLREEFGNDALQIKVAYQIISNYLRPNVFFEADETRHRIEEAVAIVPLAKDQVLKGERIIDSHEKVTAKHLEVLSSLAEAKIERETYDGLTHLLQLIGRILLIVVALGILTYFLVKCRPAVIKDPKKLLLLTLIFLLVIFVGYAINQFSLSAYLIPVAIASMLITIFFDSRLGFLCTVMLALILGGMRGNDFGVVAISIFVGSIAIMSVTKIRKRNWIIRSLGLTVAAYLLAIMVLEFLRYSSFPQLLENVGYGLINGVLTPIFTYGLFVILELIFDITTDMLFLELSDLNHPLLRELAINAPGTYHHSIMVGNLAEAAAETIGANGLVARVGAYYHDIGKLEKPDYFSENQTAGRNPQEKLSPSMSALVLLNHVRRGAEMASKHGLPLEIRNFIEQHHGTSIMSYFYQKALEQNGNKEISDTDFRYPGPKPQTREAGILMLADAVEAASRTLKEPSVSRIKALISQIIEDRFKSGELDECPLTLRNLTKIGEAFGKILIGRFHSRIDYSEKEELKSKDKNSENVKDSEGEAA